MSSDGLLPTRPHGRHVTIGVIAEAIQRAETVGGIGEALASSEIGATHSADLRADDDGGSWT